MQSPLLQDRQERDGVVVERMGVGVLREANHDVVTRKKS